jgi:hypothetical protein
LRSISGNGRAGHDLVPASNNGRDGKVAQALRITLAASCFIDNPTRYDIPHNLGLACVTKRLAGCVESRGNGPRRFFVEFSSLKAFQDMRGHIALPDMGETLRE